MSTTTTPYMGLVLPVPSSEIGPDWAAELVSALNSVDAHDHSSGKGVQVPVAGLNINADLSMNSFNLTTPRTVRLKDNGTAVTGASDLNIVHCAGGNLYYRDGSGNQIQITAAGALNATSIGGIGGDYATSTASLSYNNTSKTFIFTQSANTSAKMDFGDILLRKTSASSNAITIKAAAGLAADYTLTVPAALPGSTSFVGVDSSGNLAFTTSFVALTLSGALDFSSGSINSGSANKVIDAYTRSSGTSVGARGVAISNGSSNFTTTSTSYVDVTNLSVTITTSGRPVMLMLISDGTASTSDIIMQKNDTSSTGFLTGDLKLVRGVTDIAIHHLALGFPTDTSTGHQMGVPAACVSFIDVVAAGTYTYKLQMAAGATSNSFEIFHCRLAAFEL